MPLDFLQMRSFLPDWDAVYEKKGLEYRGSYARMKLFPLKGDLARAEIPGGGKIRKWKNDQDLTLIHKMFVSIFKEHWDFETPSMDDWRSVLKSGNFNDDLVLIAEQNGDSVGYSFGDILGSSIEDKFPSGYLISIGVLKSARRLGWGRAILSRWLTEVYGAKIKSVELDVDTSNESAIRLYESYGFKTIRTEKVWSRSLDRV
jgi:ribosomal protein S18 acetylase RimI-like enzyme